MSSLLKLITWDHVKSIGQIKILKTSYIFFLVLPIVAQFIQHVPAQITLPILDINIDIPLSMPFSWIAFFWAACFASVGHFTYISACPTLIKQFVDFPSFEKSGRTGAYLNPCVASLSKVKNGGTVEEMIRAINSKYDQDIDANKARSLLQKNEHIDAQFFYSIRDSAGLSRPVLRFISIVAYIISLLLISFVFVQNIFFIINVM